MTLCASTVNGSAAQARLELMCGQVKLLVECVIPMLCTQMNLDATERTLHSPATVSPESVGQERRRSGDMPTAFQHGRSQTAPRRPSFYN